ncbi:MAG: hypothetical protein ACR2P5_00850 [Gammaproteobacteria bacterium]
MSTIGYENWAVDLAEVGAVYPFQGGEVLMVIICAALWIGWHIAQIKSENRELEETRGKKPDAPPDDY